MELRVEFEAFVRSDNMPYRDRTRAGGVPWERPDGWHYTELVAVVIEATHDDVVDVSVPFESLDEDGLVKYDATVRGGTEELDDDRVDVLTRYTPDGEPTRETFDTSTEEFDIDDALENL